MGKYDRDIQDVYAVKQLGDAIGYGHLMAIAHELWARHLEDRGLPRRRAPCGVGYQRGKEQYQAEALNDRIYTIVVDKALEADRKTEPQTEVKVEPTWVGVTYGRFEDEPQTKRVETMSCQECKWWFTGSLKHGGYCQSLLYNHECRYEPEVDCSWK